MLKYLRKYLLQSVFFGIMMALYLWTKHGDSLLNSFLYFGGGYFILIGCCEKLLKK